MKKATPERALTGHTPCNTLHDAHAHTTVYTPYVADDLAMDMGRRNSERTRKIAENWRMHVIRTQLEEVALERERMKREFDIKCVLVWRVYT